MNGRLKLLAGAGLIGAWLAIDLLHLNDPVLVAALQGLLVGLGVNHITSNKGNPQ